MVLRKTIKEIIILVGVSVALALVFNTLSPRGIALLGQWDKGDALFVDARSQNDYDNGHIPGAVSLPVGQFEEQIESFLNRYPAEQHIVTYCSGRTCEDSHDLAQSLSDVGFTNVRIFIDGFPGWEAEGYPIE